MTAIIYFLAANSRLYYLIHRHLGKLLLHLGKTPNMLKNSTILLALLLSINLYSQNYYDSGKNDWSFGLQYDSINKNFFFHSFRSFGGNDTAVVRERIELDSSLSIQSARTIKPSTYNLQNTGSLEPLDGVSNGFFNTLIDQNKVLTKKIDLIRYNDSNITHQIPLGPDSAVYDPLILIQKRVNDTLHIIFGWRDIIDSVNSIPRKRYIKHSISTGSTNSTTIPYSTTTTRYIKDSLPFYIGSKEALKLPNNDWITLGVLEDTLNSSLYFYAFQLSPDFKTVKNSWPVNYGLGSEKKLYRKGNQIYLFNSSYRIYNGQPRQDYSIETFDYTTDTLVDRYFFELRDSTAHLEDFFGTGYFNGKHFVFAGTSDYDPTLGVVQNSLELFTVDLNFKIVNRFSYTDSSARFAGELLSLMPHPTDSNKLIYSGWVLEPTKSNTSDLIWGEYDIINNVSLPEGPAFRKARIHLFPNPSSGEVQLLYPSEDFKPYEIEIYNSEGKLVHLETVESARQTINLKLPAGAYTLYHTDGSHYGYHPLIIQ